MFDCARVPGIDGKDWSVTYAKEGDLGDDGTVVFLRKGRVWKVNASQNGTLLSTAELERQADPILPTNTRLLVPSQTNPIHL